MEANSFLTHSLFSFSTGETHFHLHLFFHRTNEFPEKGHVAAPKMSDLKQEAVCARGSAGCVCLLKLGDFDKEVAFLCSKLRIRKNRVMIQTGSCVLLG